MSEYCENCRVLQKTITEQTDVISVLQQMILEVAHAQSCEADWYTKGDTGKWAISPGAAISYQQVSTWIRRGQDAINTLKNPYKEEEDHAT